MSHFSHQASRKTVNAGLQRKELGPSLAVNILRGRSSSKQSDYNVGCLADPLTIVEPRKPKNKLSLTPIYFVDESPSSGTLMDSITSISNTTIRPRLPPPPQFPPPSPKPERAYLPDAYEDLYLSHSHQQLFTNMGWQGEGYDWRPEGSRLHENPINCLPSSEMAVKNDRGEMESVVSSREEKIRNKLIKNGSMNSLEDSRLKYHSEKSKLPRAYASADEACYNNQKHFLMKNYPGIISHRHRSPWKSFLKESTVPDVIVNRQGCRSKSPENRLSMKAKLLSPDHRPHWSLEKSVTWKDYKNWSHNQHRESDKKFHKSTTATQTSNDLQTSQMDELVSVLADLCDTIEHSSMLTRRETSPDMCPSHTRQVASRGPDTRLRAIDASREGRHLAIRPEKVVVEVRVVFLKIGEIDTLKEFYQADAFLQAKWREPRLDGKTPEELGTIDLEKYWNPLCYVDNILSETKEVQWLSTTAGANGEIYIVERRRIRGVFLETLELNDFPLDVQDLTITVTTERPDTEVDLIPDQNEMSAINKQTFVDQQEWMLHEHVEITKRVMRQEYSRSMKSHPCLSVICRAARRPGYFYWNVFLIMFMISALSFATFAVSPDKAELRLRLSFTLILTSVTFKYVITQSLPRISYLTYMDKYVLMSLAILCIISIWHAVIAILPVSLISPYEGLPTLNASAISMNVTATQPDLLQQSLTGAFQPEPPAFTKIDQPPLGSSFNRQRRKRTSFASRFSKDPYFDLPATPFTRSDEQQRAGATLGDYTLNNETVSLYFLALLRAYMEVQDRTEMGRITDFRQLEEQHRLEVMKRLEQNVFISFGVLYILVHIAFIFILYYDASKRRREMRRKDKEYQQFLRKNVQWLENQKSRDSRISMVPQENIQFETPTTMVSEMP